MNLNPERIEILLAKNGFTLTKLSERSGVPRSHISTVIRRGTAEPITVGKLAAGLGVAVEEIVRRSDTRA